MCVYTIQKKNKKIMQLYVCDSNFMPCGLMGILCA